MNWLMEDFAFAGMVLSESNLSGLAFGFFASLLAMTVGFEILSKKPQVIANVPRFFRRVTPLTLLVLAMFFAATLADLNLPGSRESRFSLTGSLLLFPACLLALLMADHVLQSLKRRPLLFRSFYVFSGVVVLLLTQGGFLLLPNDRVILHVSWAGLGAVVLVLTLSLAFMSQFVHDTTLGQLKPIRERMVHIFSITGLNQLIAYGLIGFVTFVESGDPVSWYGMWTDRVGYELITSFFALLMISALMCYVYMLFDKSVQVLRADNQKLQLLKQDALAQVANASEKLELERTRIEQLERSIELVQHDHEMSVDSLVAAVTTLEDGVFEWDIEQETMAFSSAWRRLFGLDDFVQSALPADIWRAGVLSEDIKGLDAALHACLTGEVNTANVQIRYATSYGSTLKLEINLVAVKNAYGLPSKAVGIIHDRTEEMDLELSIREELNEESLLSSRKSQFVSYLSHEIRTPMTVIGSAKALLESILQKEQINMEAALHYIDQIGGALRSLRALVDETLMFMGSNFARKHLNIALLDVAKVFNQFSSLEQRRRHGQHWFEYHLDPSLEKTDFYSDEYVFTQVMRQMLAFAESKESEAGKLTIKMNDDHTLSMCIELKAWPAWMVKGGQLEPTHDKETVVPFKGECLPFTLLLTKRVIRLINGRIMIKNRGVRHWLCVELPSLKEGSCHVS